MSEPEYEEPVLDIENIYFTMEETDELEMDINPMKEEDAVEPEVEVEQEVEAEPEAEPEVEPEEEAEVEPEAEAVKESPVSSPVIFIVPYRNREAHLAFFQPHMARLLADVDYEYRILFIHQKDSRSFNRGAMKNIGFLTVKALYPDTYKDITIVLHDIDSLLVDRVDFHTIPGTIKHFYGFGHTLGGILSINAGDFERINGFPNFWTWGYEDNMIQTRAIQAGIEIDRSVFHEFKSGPDKIVKLFQNSIRDVNKFEFDRYNKKTIEGIDSIKNLSYSINPETNFVDVYAFDTGIEEIKNQTTEYNLIYGNQPFHPNTKSVIKTNFQMINMAPHPLPRQEPKIQPATKTPEYNHTFQLMGPITRPQTRAKPTMSMRM